MTHDAQVRKLVGGAVAALAFAALSSTVSIAATPMTSTPKTYYVSKAATGVADGSSYAKAWRDVDKINWSIIQPGDTIKLDGGVDGNSMIYTGALTVQKSGTSSQPIKIVSGTEPGHNGQVLITGFYDRTPRTGVNFGDAQYVTLEGRPIKYFGRDSKSIRIANFLGDGIATGYNSDGLTLKHLEIDSNGTNLPNGPTGGYQATGVGIRFRGKWNTATNLMVHDNLDAGIEVDCAYGGYSPDIKRSWIYNHYGLGKGVGVRIKDRYRGGYSWFNISESVIGPLNPTAIEFAQRNGGVSVRNSLILNPDIAGIKKVVTGPDSYYSNILFTQSTMFLTPLNREGKSHANFSFEKGQDTITRSVIYGGVVDGKGTKQTIAINNFQYKTSGDTLAISPSQVNPKFAANVDAISATDYATIRATDFSLQPGSPAAGMGTSVTSVRKVLDLP